MTLGQVLPTNDPVPKDLAALLVEEGAASADAVTRAIERQREAGGALDTALLETGAISEESLAPLLARASELPLAPERAWTEADVRARRVFPSRVAERHGLAPFALEGRELSLVATHPVDVGLLDEISFMLSLHLTAHVGPEWRVRMLIHRLYGTPLSSRHAALAAAAGVDPAEVTSLQEPDVPPPPPPLSGFEREEGEPLEPLAAALAEAVEALGLETEEPPAPAEPEPRRSTEAEPLTPLDRTAPPKWKLADARAAIAAARDRDEVVLAALCYARNFFEFAAFFAVTKDAVAGHDALGAEGARERARALAVWSADPGIARTVIETRSPYLGPASSEAPGNRAILSGLGRETPRTALVYPVALRERIVALLYADNGQAPVSPRRLGNLLLLLSGLGAAFERIIRARKWPKPRTPQLTVDPETTTEPAPAESAERAPTMGAAEVAEDSAVSGQPAASSSGDSSLASSASKAEDGAAPAERQEPGAPEKEPSPAPVHAAVPSAPEKEPSPELVDVAEPGAASEAPATDGAGVPAPERGAPGAPATAIEAALASVEVEFDVEVEHPEPAVPESAAPRRPQSAASLEDLERQFFGDDFDIDSSAATATEPDAGAQGANEPSDSAPGKPDTAAEGAAADSAGDDALAGMGASAPASPPDDQAGRGPSSSAGEAQGGPPAAQPEPAPPAADATPAELIDRALDEDPAVASAACEALSIRRRDSALRAGYEKLRRALLSGIADRTTRAARALGALRDVEAIPLLVQVMETSEPEAAQAAASALELITLQRHGADARKWLAWWKWNRGRGRAEWLFSGLTSDDRETRLAAQVELREAADAPIEYSPDMPAPDRERAARAWAGWWARSGNVL